MNNFIVSARKYRPATFDTVVGQNAITSTLKNAIKTAHLAQAFLFCGPRGVGKTTCARILAKTINCFNITENIEACNECDSCKSFDEGQSLNVYELDAASNNSVEDIRTLIDQVRFAPQLGTHKVYIIDEVHMLSNQAFNAFLKTLEEPPKHAIFILATTEKHKIIPTILSRCQIFDFNRIQIDDIANHLSKIAEKENITAAPEGLHIIAQKADGALRDALSMFDQIVSFSGNNVTYQNVIDNLNILDYDYYFKITDAIIQKDISTSLLVFNEILNNGFDGHNFTNGLSEHFRNLLVCQDANTINLLEVGTAIKEKYLIQAKKINLTDLIQFLILTSKTDTLYKSSKNQRLLVEVMLMQLCSIENEQNEKKKPLIKLPFNDKEIISPIQYSNPIIKKDVVEEEKTNASPEKAPSEKTTITPPASVLSPQSSVLSSHSSSINSQTPNLKPQTLTNFSFADSISIKPQVPKKEEDTPKINLEDMPKDAFTEERFTEKWIAYKNQLLNKGKFNLASIFETTPLIENTTISILIENKALEDDFLAQKSNFLNFLRKELNNYEIDFITTINTDKASKKAYTPEEKFAKMSEKNPTLITLKQKLDLEIGY